MNKATGSRIGTIVSSIFTLLISLIMALYYSWKLALVGSVFVPLMIFGIYMQMKVIEGNESFEKKAFEKSAAMAIESISNIRTVVGLNCEEHFVDCYIKELSGICTLKCN